MAGRLMTRGYNILTAGCEYMSTRRLEKIWNKSRQIPTFPAATNYFDFASFHTSLQREGVTPIKMPSLSPTMMEGTIVKWLKKEGDKIAPGDVLCEIQTDKAVVALELDEEGILSKILISEDTPDIKVGTLIALMVGEDEDWKNVEVPKDVEPTKKTEVKASEGSGTKKVVHEIASTNQDRLIGPSAKNLLTKYGLKSSDVPRNGPHGALLKGDVINYAAKNNLEPVKHDTISPPGKSAPQVQKKGKEAPSKYKDIPVTNMRRTIAKRLVQSKTTVPHAYSVVEVSVSNLTNLRKRMQNLGMKASVNDFIIKSVSNALCKCPSINVAWEGTQLKQKGQIDISVAVATDAGLITPIVTNVSTKDVLSISSDIKALAEKARLGKLQPHEFMGGTFTISNLGMFGIHHFSAIINPPQCAILAVGGISLELDENGKAKPVSYLTLSYDASAISEEDAGKFMAVLKNELENVSEVSMDLFSLEDRSERMERESSN